jgi:integrase
MLKGTSKMKTAEPLRNKKDIDKLKNYFYERGEYRNYLLVIICLNTALRISDVLNIKWSDMCSENGKKIYSHLKLKEKKTGKAQSVYINKSIKTALRLFIKKGGMQHSYIFTSNGNKPLDRTCVHKILQKAGNATGIPHISCHSLRKTFGYQAWKQGVQPAVLMSIYNHSSFEITKRYLGIIQDDKDDVYRAIEL